MTDRGYTTDRLHVLRGSEPVLRRPTGHAEDVPHEAEGLRADPDFAWLGEIIDRAGTDGDVVQAGGVAVVVRRRDPRSP